MRARARRRHRRALATRAAPAVLRLLRRGQRGVHWQPRGSQARLSLAGRHGPREPRGANRHHLHELCVRAGGQAARACAARRALRGGRLGDAAALRVRRGWRGWAVYSTCECISHCNCCTVHTDTTRRALKVAEGRSPSCATRARVFVRAKNGERAARAPSPPAAVCAHARTSPTEWDLSHSSPQ